jgi:hypothetical protein
MTVLKPVVLKGSRGPNPSCFVQGQLKADILIQELDSPPLKEAEFGP